MFEAILCNLLQPMFVHDGLASKVTRIVRTAGPLWTTCFVVFFVSKDLVKVDASIWGRDFFNMVHLFSLYIPLFGKWAYSNLLICPNYQQALGKSVFTLSLHQVQHTHCQHLTLFTGVSRKLLWFCGSLCYSWDSWKDGSMIQNSKGGRTPSYLGKEAMVFVPPFSKQLKRA